MDPRWKVRHGACLVLKGLCIGLSALPTDLQHTATVALLQVLVLDRFADYIEHEMHAPVRETAACVLGLLEQDIDTAFLDSSVWDLRVAYLLVHKYQDDLGCARLIDVLLTDASQDVQAVAAQGENYLIFHSIRLSIVLKYVCVRLLFKLVCLFDMHVSFYLILVCI